MWAQHMGAGPKPRSLSTGPNCMSRAPALPLSPLWFTLGVKQGTGHDRVYNWDVCLRMRQSEATEAGIGPASPPHKP